jgi:hypothetical protein
VATPPPRPEKPSSLNLPGEQYDTVNEILKILEVKKQALKNVLSTLKIHFNVLGRRLYCDAVYKRDRRLEKSIISFECGANNNKETAKR